MNARPACEICEVNADADYMSGPWSWQLTLVGMGMAPLFVGVMALQAGEV